MAGAVFSFNIDLRANTRGMTRGFQQARGSITHFSRDVGSVTRQFASFTTGIIAATGALVGLGSAAAAIKSVVTVGAEFEHSMSRVLALTEANADQFGALREQARSLGETTQFTARDAAEAQSVFALAGFDVNSIMKALPATLDLAAAGQISIAESAGIAARIMAGMKVEAKDLGSVVDVLAKTMSSSQTDVMSLGEAFKFVGPIGAITEKSITEVASAIAIMSDAGISGEMAGTALRGVLTKMAGPTKEANELMDALGISFLDAQGKIRPLADVVDNVRNATAGLGSGDVLGVLSTLFEQRAATGFATLLQAGGDELRAFEDRLKSAGGTADRIANVQLDNLTGDFVKLKSAMETTRIRIFDEMSGGLREVTQDMTTLVQGFNQLASVALPLLGEELRAAGYQFDLFAGSGQDASLSILNSLETMSLGFAKLLDDAIALKKELVGLFPKKETMPKAIFGELRLDKNGFSLDNGVLFDNNKPTEAGKKFRKALGLDGGMLGVKNAKGGGANAWEMALKRDFDSFAGMIAPAETTITERVGGFFEKLRKRFSEEFKTTGDDIAGNILDFATGLTLNELFKKTPGTDGASALGGPLGEQPKFSDLSPAALAARTAEAFSAALKNTKTAQADPVVKGIRDLIKAQGEEVAATNRVNQSLQRFSIKEAIV